MRPPRLRYRTWLAAALTALALIACSPPYNWREASDSGSHFVVLLPGKPATLTRSVNLDGLQADMRMTAAEAGGATFAVGTAELADSAVAVKALDAMAIALLNNIGGQPHAAVQLPGKTDGFSRSIDLDARGAAGGRTLRMVVRLAAKDRRIYQVLILGDEKALTDENIETFFSSFKPT